MSLDSEERERTRRELRANVECSGLSLEQVARDLAMSATRLASTLDLRHADPVDVWLLRDYLDMACRDAGHEPARYTVLTEQARMRARAWFALREPPRHDPTTT